MIAKLLRSSSGSIQSPSHIIMAPTGGGNIGDQALIEAAFRALKGNITVVGTTADSLTIPLADRDRVKFESASGFIYLPPVLRFGNALKLARLMSTARTFSVVGADLMDGAYNPGASLARSSALWLAAKHHIPSVLLGCSWANSAVGSCASALARAGRAGAQLNFRDATSQERALNQGIVTALLTSDIVFSDDTMDAQHGLSAFCKAARKEGRNVALVNASGLVAKKVPQTEEYVTIVNELLQNNFSVVLLPHVFRATGDDLEQCRTILEMFSPSTNVTLVDSMLPPSTIRSLCRDADLVITGRMHLAVMALGRGVVPITLGTHGKVEGLYRHFQGLDFYVDPQVGFGHEVAKLIPRAMKQNSEWKSSLPAVESLSKANFRLLTDTALPAQAS
ncbi:polysaccharide pyruvyl transferase family protein [Pseudarthrobacter sp. CCNWLW207]|uniref:polysaccharide pyruvyl transferase family protein n=1 Tax=Pseudarthrobacter sp. CCNWLW207 TaxID=3127468 RepID=UPI0030789F48